MNIRPCRVGIDVGGTFTDFCLFDSNRGSLTCHKTPSTPHAPELAILQGLPVLLEKAGTSGENIGFVGHGTTVATNLLIERGGARTALVTTRGFRDVLEIARQTRPNLYDYSQRRAEPLVPRHLRFEIDERLDADGNVLRELDEKAVWVLADTLAQLQITAVAVCLINAYRNPSHEARLCELLRQRLPDCYICASHEVLPEFREFERTATTVANAFVGPIMTGYIGALDAGLRTLGITAPLYTFHSNGGMLSQGLARQFPVRTCLSGPAAGVVGAAALGRRIGESNLVAFDVGGTSTDVSLIANGVPELRGEREVAGFPIKSPSLDVHVIGAGGGSIAWVDGGGALRVGPRSAGANPGPAAYGLGGREPTLTDANLVLGRLGPRGLLDGHLPLDVPRAHSAINEHLAQPLRLDTNHAAEGVIQVAVANIARAIRAVSTERGHRLSQFTLMAYGGAGPVLAGAVARETGCRRVIVPNDPGAMCARGVLVADMSIDLVRTRLIPLEPTSTAELHGLCAQLFDEASSWFEVERVPRASRRVELGIEARYLGQGFEISVPLARSMGAQSIVELQLPSIAELQDRYRIAHQNHYGYALEERAVEVVNCRLKAVATLGNEAAIDTHLRDSPPAIDDHTVAKQTCDTQAQTRAVYFHGHGTLQVTIVERAQLASGVTRYGPLIVEELTSTLVVFPDDTIEVDPHGNIVMLINS